MPRFARSFLAAMAALLAAPATAAAPADASPYAVLAALEARVAAVGFRLTTANASHCAKLQPQFGWIWGDPRLYDASNRTEARAAYSASDADTPYIAAIAPGSPAATAGLRVGTAVQAVDGFVPAAEGSDAFARIAALETRLGAQDAARTIEVDPGDGRRIAVRPVPGCVSDFRVEARDRAAGQADGRLVLISAGLARFAADDDELAAAVAHELAHNILRHRARLDAAGVDRGLGKQFGRSAKLFRQTEVEADRLSVWLMRAAGYDPDAAVRFWQRFGQRNGPVLFQAGTHPRWQDRVRALETEIAAIHTAEASGKPLDPPLIATPPPLE
ncbi:M48 family metallopeptidase [Sphingopyxis macrogoltabida]|uniref:Peptidase M48, Ste24p n=1 Tax=Sphingopyxis macrogoltabida TaxID=33050 RepID=A0AAC8YWY1_SPHMC|nr:M48 family metallopeptidase [Sphingopyxis macrogoltabida]ALJ11480.1 peptidase M48, Ste24p [Sphingopyxis macrogoltabida]AMU87672.1 peptidase M48, Ste24p [Sphingopyxis macrogoltabida]